LIVLFLTKPCLWDLLLQLHVSLLFVISIWSLFIIVARKDKDRDTNDKDKDTKDKDTKDKDTKDKDKDTKDTYTYTRIHKSPQKNNCIAPGGKQRETR